MLRASTAPAHRSLFAGGELERRGRAELASIEVLGKAPEGPLAGMLAETGRLGYGGVFLLGAALSACFLVLLPLLRPRSAETSGAA